MNRIIFRLLLFSITFYYVIERMYTCEIKNEIAFLLLFSFMILSIIVFMLTKKDIVKCNSCHQIIGH